MKVVIIEDEAIAANCLVNALSKVDKNIQIVAILVSVKKAIEWFSMNEKPDLIFSDIQLGDGLSFEIFKSISCTAPIIFCTAYNEYALNAFKVNGIDYILKPIDNKIIADALAKYSLLKDNFSDNTFKYDKILELFNSKITQNNSSVLANYKTGIIPINISDIAYFYIENEITYLITFEQKKYSINKYLEELNKITNNEFYRVNKQYLINRKIVENIQKYSDNQYLIYLNISFLEKVFVRRAKVNDFLEWLTKK